MDGAAQIRPFAPLTPEAFLAAERQARRRHEYAEGRAWLRPDCNRNHVLLTGAFAFTLTHALRGRCVVFASMMRVQAGYAFTYPDVVVVCGDEKYRDDKQDTLLNPALIIEVLSPSTEPYDRGKKFAFYRTIPTLQEYVLVAADRPSVEVFRRNEAGRFELYEATDGTVTLASVGCTVALDDVYADVRFDPAG